MRIFSLVLTGLHFLQRSARPTTWYLFGAVVSVTATAIISLSSAMNDIEKELALQEKTNRAHIAEYFIKLLDHTRSIGEITHHILTETPSLATANSENFAKAIKSASLTHFYALPEWVSVRFMRSPTESVTLRNFASASSDYVEADFLQDTHAKPLTPLAYRITDGSGFVIGLGIVDAHKNHLGTLTFHFPSEELRQFLRSEFPGGVSLAFALINAANLDVLFASWDQARSLYVMPLFGSDRRLSLSDGTFPIEVNGQVLTRHIPLGSYQAWTLSTGHLSNIFWYQLRHVLPSRVLGNVVIILFAYTLIFIPFYRLYWRTKTESSLINLYFNYHRNRFRFFQQVVNALSTPAAFNKEQPPMRGVVNLQVTLGRILTLQEEYARDHHVLLLHSFPNPMPNVKGDPFHTEYFLSNLIRYAISSVPAHRGKVTVSASLNQVKECVEIHIEDNGLSLNEFERAVIDRLQERLSEHIEQHTHKWSEIVKLDYTVIHPHIEFEVCDRTFESYGSRITVRLPYAKKPHIVGPNIVPLHTKHKN